MSDHPRDLLPVPVVVALLRITRGRPPAQGDEDVLFDEFSKAGPELVVQEAMRRLLGRIPLEREVVRARGQLDAVLVDMLREHRHRRDDDDDLLIERQELAA